MFTSLFHPSLFSLHPSSLLPFSSLPLLPCLFLSSLSSFSPTLHCSPSLDALMFGYHEVILQTPLPSNDSLYVHQATLLCQSLKLCKRIRAVHFSDKEQVSRCVLMVEGGREGGRDYFCESRWVNWIDHGLYIKARLCLAEECHLYLVDWLLLD